MSASLPIPIRHNLSIAATLFLFHFFILVILPLFLLPHSMMWILLIPLFIWVHNTHWGLIHEAVHRLFSPSSVPNEAAGRMLSILLGASFHVLRFGHLMHHQYNRLWESEIHRGPQITWKAHLVFYSKLFGGLYLTEVVITLLLTLLPASVLRWLIKASLGRMFPPAAVAAERVLFQRRKLPQVRQDGTLIILLYGAAFYLYGAYWPWLLAFLYSRALAISFFDNIYHYDTATDNSEAAMDLAMPRFASLLLLHGNYHETHHLQPDVPWHFLPQCQHGNFHKSLLEGAQQQLKGPILSRQFPAYSPILQEINKEPA